jgi:hypothetical protein
MQANTLVAQASRDGFGAPRQPAAPNAGARPPFKSAQPPPTKPTQRVQSVLQAEQQGLIHTTYQSLGGSSGDSVLLIVVKVRGPERLFLSVPTGLYLSNPLTAAQDMVVSGLRGRDTGDNMYEPLRLIALADDKPTRYIIEAYCAEFHKGNPRTRSAFTSADAIDPVHACILDGAKVRKLSTSGTQAAIWIYTDRVDFREMNTRMEISSTEWARGRSLATTCIERFGN